MQKVERYLIGGNAAVVGTLFWLDKSRQRMGALERVYRKGRSVWIELRMEDDSVQAMPASSVCGPVYFDSPFRKQLNERRPQDKDRPPAKFESQVYREFNGVTFALGDEIYFPDEGEAWVRAETGHTGQLCLGHLVQINLDGSMLVMMNAKCVIGVQKFVFLAQPEELEVVLRCNRQPDDRSASILSVGPKLGANSVRIRTVIVD